MMKKEIKGKKYTKKVSYTPEGPEDNDEFSQIIIRTFKLINSAPSNFDERLSFYKDLASKILKAKKLPIVSKFHFKKKNRGKLIPGNFSVEEIEYLSGPYKEISPYVLEKKFKQDSPEHFAARILDTIFYIEKEQDVKKMLDYAFHLGHLVTFAYVYGIDLELASKGGALSKKTPQWADEFVKMIIEEFPGMSAREVWDSLEDQDWLPVPSGWTIIKDKENGYDKLFAERSTGKGLEIHHYKMPWSTFKNKFYKLKKTFSDQS
jgi:hypothetical protein